MFKKVPFVEKASAARKKAEGKKDKIVKSAQRAFERTTAIISAEENFESSVQEIEGGIRQSIDRAIKKGQKMLEGQEVVVTQNREALAALKGPSVSPLKLEFARIKLEFSEKEHAAEKRAVSLYINKTGSTAHLAGIVKVRDAENVRDKKIRHANGI